MAASGGRIRSFVERRAASDAVGRGDHGLPDWGATSSFCSIRESRAMISSNLAAGSPRMPGIGMRWAACIPGAPGGIRICGPGPRDPGPGPRSPRRVESRSIRSSRSPRSGRSPRSRPRRPSALSGRSPPPASPLRSSSPSSASSAMTPIHDRIPRWKTVGSISPAQAMRPTAGHSTLAASTADATKRTGTRGMAWVSGGAATDENTGSGHARALRQLFSHSL